LELMVESSNEMRSLGHEPMRPEVAARLKQTFFPES
jgi:hypothetical protein